jgi:hypothetical protein
MKVMKEGGYEEWVIRMRRVSGQKGEALGMQEGYVEGVKRRECRRGTWMG